MGPVVRTGDVEEVEESMVFVRLESGVGRDMSGGEIAAMSANVSKKMDRLSLTLGGVFGCFRSGCANLGIWISTCLGLDRAPAAVESSLEGGKVTAVSGGSLSRDKNVENEPDLDSGGASVA